MIINESLICLDLNVENKRQALISIVDIVKNSGRLNKKEDYLNKVIQREKEFSTDMGFGVAIPHGRTDTVNEPFVFFAKLRKPIVWNEEENSEIDLIFMIGVPENSEDNIHLKILSQLAAKLVDEDYINALRKVTKKDEIENFFKEIKT